MKPLLIIKRIFLILTAAFLLMLGSLAFISYYYQDQLVSLFIKEANKKINTPVQVEHIEISIFKKFPQVAVHFRNVTVQESIEGSSLPLLKAESIFCTFNPINFFRKNFEINQIHLEEAQAFVRLTASGLKNYDFLKPASGSGPGVGDGSEVRFDLEKILLKNTFVIYFDEAAGHRYSFNIDQAQAGLSVVNDLYLVDLTGDLLTEKIQVREESYFRNKQLNLETQLVYDDQQKLLKISPSLIRINQSLFSIEGEMLNQGLTQVDLKVSGQDTDIQTILSLLSEDIYNQLKSYQSKGQVYFNGTVKGAMNQDHTPRVDLNFGCNNASFFHPKYNQSIHHVDLKGSFTNGSKQNLQTSRLLLENVKGEIDQKPFTGNLEIRDFDNYYLDLKLKADLNINSVLKFYPLEKVASAEGQVGMDIHFKGHVKDVKNTKVNRISSEGEINLTGLNFRLKDIQLPFRKFNGNFIFNDDALAISNFSGQIGHSDFLMNGLFKNVLAYLFLKDQPIKVEADLSSGQMDVDELLSGNLAAGGGNGESEIVKNTYSFRISPKLDIDFNCSIKDLTFRRFTGQNIKGELIIRNQKATSPRLTFEAFNGRMALHGTVDARQENHIEVFTTSRFNGIDIDRVFFVFENFDQHFLMDHHLKGQIYADVNTFMVFDNQLKMNTDELISDIELSIRNGELNYFAPMQNLNKYVSEKSLEHLKFSELKNEILIQNRKIHLPEMEVGSNITKIKVSGTHTFDQVINYRLMVPLERFNEKDKDEKFGPIEDDGKGNLHVFLKIEGTTDNYRISYDSQGLKANIKENIKNEGKELKQIFKNKGQEEQEAVELDEEEYFKF